MKKTKGFSVFLSVVEGVILFVLLISLIYFSLSFFLAAKDTPSPDQMIQIDTFALSYAFILIFSLITYGSALFLSIIFLPFILLCLPDERKKHKRRLLLLALFSVLSFLIILLMGIFSGII